MAVEQPEALARPYSGEMVWSASASQDLARELLCGSADRWAHVQLVASTLEQILEAEPSRDSLVSAGWLHDIGYAPQLRDTGLHAVDGAVFLDRAGAPSEVVSLVAFHTGAEFEAEERGLVDALLQFDRPAQENLDVLILADLLSGPTGTQITVGERLDEIPSRYEPQHPVHRALLRSRPYLEQCAARAAALSGYPM